MLAPDLTAAVTPIMDEMVANAITAVQTVNYNGFGPANASGLLAKSISWRATEDGYAVVVTGEAAKYVGTLRHGRRKGGGPPVAVIKEWMDIKGVASDVTDDKQRMRIAAAITMKIRKEGNYVHRNGLAPTNIWDNVVTPAQLSNLAGITAKYIIENLR